MVLSQLSSPWMDGTLFLSMGVKKYEGRLLSIRRASQAAVLLLVSGVIIARHAFSPPFALHGKQLAINLLRTSAEEGSGKKCSAEESPFGKRGWKMKAGG